MGVALAPLMMATTAVSGGLSAISQIRAGNASGAASEYRAQVADNNAKTAEMNATMTMQAGDTATANAGMKTAEVVGRQKAAQGANNIDVNSGSATQVRSATAALGMLDALTIRSNAAREAYGYQVQGSDFKAEANLDRATGKEAKASGWLGAAGSLLSTASTVGKDYSRWQTQNPGGQSRVPSSIDEIILNDGSSRY